MRSVRHKGGRRLRYDGGVQPAPVCGLTMDEKTMLSFQLLRFRRHLLACCCALLCASGLASAQTPAASAAPTLVLPDGGQYYGALHNGQLQGTGRLVWGATRQYEGTFEAGRMQGQGTLRVSHGVYEGQFKDGDLNGPGRYTGKNGESYEGQFVAGEYDGQGVFKDGSGNRYEGQFQQGQFSGQGVLTDSSGQTVRGTFKDWQPTGILAVSYPGGITYTGEMDGDRPKGQGELRLANGKRIRGDFSQAGSDTTEILYPNGDRYVGQVVATFAHGKGTLTRTNGDVYQGQMQRDKPYGQGTLSPAKGSKASAQTGQWRMGQYVGQTDASSEVEDTTAQAAINNQTALYAQNHLLAAQMAQLRPNDPAKTEMYALLIAGDGTQEVFRREVEYVNQSFAKRYDTAGRTLVLANSRSSVSRLPLATDTSIERALGALAQQMDKERDLLFVFLTSHGSKTHDLSIDMRGMRLPQLSAQRLAALLKASGIRKQIVVVSACYSGGFIDPLKGPTTWVITASRADRTSFGCADENDFTYFGRALFKESLPQAANLSDAFAKAQVLVQEWEAKLALADDGSAPDAAKNVANAGEALPEAAAAAAAKTAVADKVEHSEPQMAVQPAFQKEVDAWFAGRR